ncbi:carbon-nitrogen hydrolase family protein [Shinella yambaruensis]|uniref:Hydrolase n=1 Tax=Shinella yambaruensis TaxID=415996 RepID=A0ABQ5ZH39_9HYPH|nr:MULTISPECIES: carbon-nitrogen hydrolase family protein [Shinella]CAI0335691.1 Hydrolase in pqqF 5'region [Rhizobiaceae bacterium]CAK7259994.1 Hydrolase in pqqF 5'region [Shinella sp. WSC3-e]MCJ8024634.1 carbon-nitrogen hydrolase family protein [Shinella yambaruensis]MCO5138178.1 carbon-nitrogen hydrolase family protein [Shinella sp.]MCU7979087.1 carbon-nitrogen hydrolase family protein [Shinella yambaruensis]
MRIAALQMHAIAGDGEANIERIAAAAADAAAGGAKLLVVPELAVTGYGAGEAAFARLASPATGDVARRLGAIARDNGLAIVTGFAEQEGAHVYNSALFTDGIGTNAVYRKSHLYGEYERGVFRPAAPASVMVELGGIRLGMLICYDVEFPENVRRLALAGADLVIVPTALPKGSSGTFIASHMIQVRAFENQVFVAYINHCGADDRFTYAGLSRIAAPDGKLLAEASAEGETLLFAEIRPEDYAKSRSENTYLVDLARQG